MGLWSLYFLAKIYLYFRGILKLDLIPNALFLILLFLPTPGKFAANRAFAIGRKSIHIVLGFLLLWHDSWLPPLRAAISFVQEEGLPLKEYTARFLIGFINPVEMALLGSLLFMAFMLRRHVRLTAVVVVLLIFVPLRGFGENTVLAQKTSDSFFQEESKKIIHFDGSGKQRGDFDVIFLQVCSLSWDDLREIGLAESPFWKEFDVVFARFNSVTSYSNPAALRLLRSNCGQKNHDALFSDMAADCDVMEALRAVGYKTYFTLNHNGTYSNFAREVGKVAVLDAPLLPAGLPVTARNFDGSPIYDDSAVLGRWWALRQASRAGRAALYYNTVSLHDGAHWVEDSDWWKKDRAEQYRERVERLFDEFSRFFELIGSSGRRAVIFFVPEHGMALRGNALQVSGFRDIPLPRITIVPVGIKFINGESGGMPAHHYVITKATSFHALSYFLASFIKNDPFQSAGVVFPDLIENVPATEFVSENKGVRLVQVGAELFLYGKEKKWINLPAEAMN